MVHSKFSLNKKKERTGLLFEVLLFTPSLPKHALKQVQLKLFILIKLLTIIDNSYGNSCIAFLRSLLISNSILGDLITTLMQLLKSSTV